jgi:hypothetical protein
VKSYLSLADFKREGVADIEGPDLDTRILQMLENISQRADEHTGRNFASVTRTRYFSGNGRDVLRLTDIAGDLIAVTSLKEDSGRDGTHATEWAATDYFLAPYDADPIGLLGEPRPFSHLEVNQLSTGTKSHFAQGQRRFELTGKWGYSEKTEAVGTLIDMAGGMDSSETTLTVDDGSLISIGDTLMVETEQMYVSAKPPSNDNSLTAVRGVNGTTAAAHDDDTAVSRIVYPGALVEAVLIQASQVWTGRASGFTRRSELADADGPVFYWSFQSKQLLDKFRLVMVA